MNQLLVKRSFIFYLSTSSICLLGINHSAVAQKVYIDHGYYEIVYSPKKEACNAIGSGDYFGGYPSTQSQYQFNRCKSTPGCYVEALNEVNAWFCRGAPACSNEWHPSEFCHATKVIHCDANFKPFYDQCKKIHCEGNMVIGEHRRESIRNGTKYHYCQADGINTVVNCKPGFQYDGFGCYKYIP